MYKRPKDLELSRQPILLSEKIMASAFFLLCLFSAAMTLTKAEVYKVGDSAGWTVQGNVNYTAWASGKNFHKGDILLFEYDRQYHNVLVVSKVDFVACNAASPLATHTSGNDSIPVDRAGHYYFICGFPGHCNIGQKVDIHVL